MGPAGLGGDLEHRIEQFLAKNVAGSCFGHGSILRQNGPKTTAGGCRQGRFPMITDPRLPVMDNVTDGEITRRAGQRILNRERLWPFRRF